MRGQLVLDRRVVLGRVGAVDRREVEHVHEQSRALDVGEEVVPEAGALARALDQSGDVGEHELAVVGVDRAEHRLERRERVVGDLRRRARQAGQQRGLAGVRQPDEADVGEQLEVQLDPALLARQAALGEARRLARRRREVLVAATGRAALRDDGDLAGRRRGRGACRPPAPRPCPAARGPRARSPSGPKRSAPLPWPPRLALKWAVRRKNCRSRSESSQTSTTSPPRPPSPPSGPPFGTRDSRRNDMQPSPPPPAWTWIRALSDSIGPS